MAALYSRKSRLDDLVAKELKYADYYDYTLYNSYLTHAQIDDMNTVFKERKGIFEDYNEFRGKTKVDVQTTSYVAVDRSNGKKYAYIDALKKSEIA